MAGYSSGGTGRFWWSNHERHRKDAVTRFLAFLTSRLFVFNNLTASFGNLLARPVIFLVILSCELLHVWSRGDLTFGRTLAGRRQPGKNCLLD
jgi:hypothetical protein